jgi:hypothetical protein
MNRVPRVKPANKVDRSSVYDVGAPHIKGKVIKTGPEVSEVLWDNGRKQYVPNDWLRYADGGVYPIGGYNG